MSAPTSPEPIPPDCAVSPLAAGLYLIATPIGNLGDLTLRARAVMGRLDLLLCEDTRVTRKLLSAFGLSLALESYHAHNAASKERKVLDALRSGKAVGLVSDAGTPLLSDPGEQLVQAVVREGFPLTALPGANALLPALCLSGLPANRFFFAGFLPPRALQRRAEIAGFAALAATLIFYESPHRLAACLADLYAVLGDRPAAVARELTKRYEEVRRGSLSTLLAHYRSDADVRGEVVVLVGPPGEDTLDDRVTDDALDAALRTALASTTVRDAAVLVSARTGRPRREVYARALALSRGGAREHAEKD